MLGDKIKELRQKGYTFNQIAAELGCSKGSVSYHLSPGQKEKAYKRVKKRRKKDPIMRKIYDFRGSRPTKGKSQTLKKTSEERFYNKMKNFSRDIRKSIPMKLEFNTEDVKNKLGDNPKCYLTGRDIDLNKTNSYHFDHIIPRSRGGDNSLENLGVCTADANKAKTDKTPDEFFHLCKQVLEYNGYKVEKE